MQLHSNQTEKVRLMRSFDPPLILPSQFEDRRFSRHSCGLLGAIFCAVLLSSIDWAARAQGFPRPAPDPPGVLLDVGGYRVHVYCTGSGKPAVVIVGGAFSFDWDLVQSSVARFTRVCTFDPSGTAWSDPFQTAVRALDPGAPSRSTPTCGDRVAEIHRVITRGSIGSPYLLVGFSVGALWERLYAASYPEGIAGMVIVDQAFLPGYKAAGVRPANASGHSGPVLMARVPIAIGFEDDVNFGKLPQRDQQYHKWAIAEHPLRPDETMAADCLSEIDHAIGNQPYPLGNTPLTVVRTENGAPGYAEMQAKLLGLSHRARQVVAWNSSHMVPIDDPETIVSAIQALVENTRDRKISHERR
jgi:pimeloyl-ACP methyl ester carboxylesterase